jgi:hypothetical protein
MARMLGWLAVACALLAGAEAYFVTVDAHAEECFFDKVKLCFWKRIIISALCPLHILIT